MFILKEGLSLVTKNAEICVTADLIQLLTPEQAWHYHIIPKASTHETIELYFDETLYHPCVHDELEIVFNKRVVAEKCSSEIIKKGLGKYYRRIKNESKILPSSVPIDYSSEDFLYKLINEAKSLGSSDIHIESYEERSRVRLRIDGKLIEKYIIHKEEYPALINKIKIKAKLDIAEKRLPQDGRIIIKNREHQFDIRVSVLPSHYGEKIVLRLLSRNAGNINIDSLGFSERQYHAYLESIKKTQGIILISGPTGSGKTTTLYATLKILNSEQTNILTIEDPIEYTLSGINQVQLKESIGLTFASALRTFLRQDPDIIMLGEIRDQETANMAIRAALTGHLVLSTIHTNSAWGVVSRLCDMGVPSYLLANTLNLAVAQRLVRLLCPHCKKSEKFQTGLLPLQYVLPYKIEYHFMPVGCDQCYYTGYKGRKAVYEVIPVDFELSEKIKSAAFDISGCLNKKLITPLAHNAFNLMASGETSVEEIYAILLNF